MSLCKGDYIGIVNSDDVYEKNALEIIYKYLQKDKHKKLDFIFGSVRKHWESSMDINHKKYTIAGVSILVILLVF